MKQFDRRVFRDGIIAGLIGAALVAIWFDAFDTINGQPLRTPALLGAILFKGLRDPQALQISLRVVLGYTFLHILAFTAFGLLCAILISTSEREPALLWAFVALLACFEVFFIAVVGLFSLSTVGASLWWAVLVGNLLASVGMLTYFFVGHRTLGQMLLGKSVAVVREGIIGGLIGAAAVAIWFLAYDTFRGQPLQTPALLGTAVFSTVTDPQAVPIDLDTIAGYTVLHCLAFIFFGIVAAFLIVAAEHQPILLIGLFMLFSSFEVFFFGLVVIFAQSIMGALVWWAIFAGNLLATAAMLVYFFLGHRALGRKLTERWPER